MDYLFEDVKGVKIKRQNGIKKRIVNLIKNQPIDDQCTLTDALLQIQKILDDFEKYVKS